MEELDEDDFSDLYADVEVQASSALSAMHRSTEKPLRSGCVVANAARGSEIGGGHRKFHKLDAATEVSEKDNGGGMRNFPVEDRYGCESRIASESEDLSGKLNGDSDDGVERITDEDFDNEKYHYRESDDEIGEISEKEKTVDGGDHGSERKILKHNSFNSDKKRVDEMGHRKCEKGNADSRDPLFNRARVDKQPNYKWKHGGQKIASERHTQTCYPVPLDVDKHGSVQISDSVEDSPREGSEFDSEGMSGTSRDTNRRKVNCINNKLSSRIGPESSKSSQSQHGRGYSYSPSRDELGSRYFERSRKRSRYSPSSLHYELREPSERHVVKRGTEDGRYHKRWRDGMREYYNRPNKSNYVPYFKNLPDEDASYAIDTEHHCNRGVNRGKPREMDGFPYFSQSKRILTDSGGFFPDHHLGPAFLKGEHWDIPYCKYKSGRPDGHNMSGRRNSLDHQSSQMDYEEALEHNGYQNQRRYPFQADIKGSRNLAAPKYSSAVPQRDTQFMYRGDSVHRRRRTRQDILSPLYEYDDRFVEGKVRRIFPNSNGDRGRLGHSCDRNVTCDRREVEISEREKRRCHSPVYSPRNLSYIGSQVNERRTIKYRPLPFYPSEEPYACSRWEYIGVPGKRFGAAQQHIRCSWKEMHFEYDQCGTDVANFVRRENVRYHPSDDRHIRRRDYEQSPNASTMRNYIKDNQYQDHFADRRHRHRSEKLHSREHVFKPRQQDNIVSGAESPSHHFKKNSKNCVNDRHALCRELNEKEKGRQNSCMLREEDSSKHFDGFHKSSQLHSNAQMLPSRQDSVDHLVVVGRKCTLQSSIRRTTEAGEDTFYGRHDLMECNEKETKTVPTDEGNIDASLGDRNKSQLNEFQDIEEGQIITKEMQKATKRINVTVHPETASDGNGIAERLDDEKIREIMMKMERRRERFKEPIALSRDCEKTSSPLPESNCETTEARLERPARKRRWLGT